jgi:hypothetical protein
LLAMGFRQSDIEVDIGELPSSSVGTVVLLIVETETGVAGSRRWANAESLPNELPTKPLTPSPPIGEPRRPLTRILPTNWCF